MSARKILGFVCIVAFATASGSLSIPLDFDETELPLGSVLRNIAKRIPADVKRLKNDTHYAVVAGVQARFCDGGAKELRVACDIK